MGAGGIVGMGIRELLVLTSMPLCVAPALTPSFSPFSLSVFLLFHVLTISMPVFPFSAACHFLPPHPSILGISGMLGDLEQGSVLEEPNLKEMSPVIRNGPEGDG